MLLVPWCGEIKIYRVDQKNGPQTHDHNSVKYLPVYKFFTGKFLSKFGVKWILNIPSHHANVATLPCETLMSKQAISDNLQGSVATYSKCGGVVID